MKFENKKVFISGAYRDFGKTLATFFARQGAELFVTVRGEQAQRETLDYLSNQSSKPVHVYNCDLVDAQAISKTVESIQSETQHLDIIVNNAAMWLEGSLASASDEDVVNTINSGVTGALLLIKNLEPLLLKSATPDVVNMVSVCGKPNFSGSSAHEAFYAMKHGQSGLANILTERLKERGVRVISLYPPDFHNIGEEPELWNAPEKATFGSLLTSRELVETIEFALTRPRSCMMNQIFFEDTRC